MSASSTPPASTSIAPRAARSGLLARLRAWLRGGERILTVGVDLQLMQPGGANGGVKPLVYSFLREIGRAHGTKLRFVFVAHPGLATELAEFMRPGDTQQAPGTEPRPAFDVLYAPFGRSALMNPAVPTVSLIVDLLHRDLPAALPIEEVNYRHEWFTQVAKDAAAFQCISHYTAARLQAHYGVAPERCFVTHLPVHQRLDSATAPQKAAPAPIAGKFFFYPANFWPHKNHETLLAAYQTYRAVPASAGVEPWPLVLTGYPDARMAGLVREVAARGLSAHVHFLGHVGDAEFAALWRAAGALVYPSLHEGFGIPLLEAMAFGCPIIAASATSLPEVGGDACLYVDPRDPAALAAALSQMSGDEALRCDLVARGARRLGEFSLTREAAKLATALRSAASRPRATG